VNFFVGISRSFRRVREVCEAHDVPMMLSAGALYDRARNRLRPYPKSMHGAKVAIDSAGFTAMTVHGGVYPWSADEYLDLVEQANAVWYASRDYCVEPSIAKDASVRADRIRKTVDEYASLCAAASARGLPAPMPVLQGWFPHEYIECWHAMGRPSGLVGIGSVCRRHLRGRDGLLAILDELSAHGVERAHLFGVKGASVDIVLSDMFLARMVDSVDSHAWDYGARMSGIKSIDERLAYLSDWIEKQTRRIG